VTDNQIKARVKAVLGGASPDSATSEHPLVGTGGPLHPDHALQVLTLAQRTAEEHVAIAKRQADKIRSDAQAAADRAPRDAQGHAEQLKHQAQQRYEDSVGSLIAKRGALQQQIEALEQFDREYRARLTTFMQGQLRALWVDRPQVGTDLQAPVPDVGGAEEAGTEAEAETPGADENAEAAEKSEADQESRVTD
jgi:cell division septum initiation protein DivIVA